MLPATSPTKYAASFKCKYTNIYSYPAPGTSATATISESNAGKSEYAASKVQHRLPRLSNDTSNPSSTVAVTVKLLGVVSAGQEITWTDAAINEFSDKEGGGSPQ